MRIADYKRYILELFTMSLPIMMGNVGHTLIGAVDVWVASKYDISTLSAIALANAILFCLIFIGIGLLIGISIIIANKRGEKKPTKKHFISGIILSQILALLIFGTVIISAKLIPYFGFDESLIPNIQTYMYITSFSIFGMYLYQAIKEFLLAYEIVNFPNAVILISVVLNAILSWYFVFGGFGFHGFGAVVGIGLATLLVRMFMGIALVIYTLKLFKRKNDATLFDMDYIKQVIKVGTPIGAAIFIEFLAYNLITIKAGLDNPLFPAVHNILLTLVDTAYMVPLSISAAMSIKIGFFNGAKNLVEIKRYSVVGIIMGCTFMSMCSILFFLKPEMFIGIFSKDKIVFDIAVGIVPIFSLFVLADGMQVSLSGILKGIKQTKAVTACILSSYWLVGIPLAFYFAYNMHLQLMGFWLGLTCAVFTIAITETVVIIYQIIQKRKENYITN